MNYTVIARRWRPRKFEDVIGQPHVVTTLKNSISRGRIAHAYLFSGPRGVGKTSISRILAKAVNCLEGTKEEPCNACHTCAAIDSGGYVDVIEIDAASNTHVEQMKELIETVRYLPMEGRYKVYIIDEVHMLSTHAFNALLKTLEEPPGHNIFILATTENQKIPYTIVSRCQRFDFRRISEQHIIEQLKRICIDENIECDDKVLNYVVREADGSLRDAESILDQVIAYSGKHITESDAIDVIGVVQREVAYGIVKSIVERDARGGLEFIASTLERGHDAYQVYRGLVSFLRDLLMVKVWNGKPPFVFIDDDEYERVRDLLKTVEYYEIQNMVHHLLQAEDLIRGVFPKISLEILYINLYNLSQLRDVERLLESGPVQEQPRTPKPAVITEAPKVIERAIDIVPQTVISSPAVQVPATKAGDFETYLREKDKMLFGIFGALDMKAEGDRLVVALDKRSGYMKNEAAIVNGLKRYASEFFGKDMTIGFVDGSGKKVDSIDDYVREAELLFKT